MKGYPRRDAAATVLILAVILLALAVAGAIEGMTT